MKDKWDIKHRKGETLNLHFFKLNKKEFIKKLENFTGYHNILMGTIILTKGDRL